MRTQICAAIFCGLGRRSIAGLIFLLGLAISTTGTGLPVSRENGPERWVATWSTALHEPDLFVPGLSNAGFDNQTLRQIVHTSIGGRQLRVRFSAFGAKAVVIGAAHVGLAASGSAIIPGSDRVLTFGGRASITIPAGAPVISDPIELAVPPVSDLAVTIFVPGATAPAAWHFEARQTSFISPTGDFTSADIMPFESTRTAWFWLSGIEVMASPDTGAIAVIGDSITDGTNSTVDSNSRWTDELARRLLGQRQNSRLGVLNLGIAGNRLLHDGLGPSALARFDRDVLSQSGLSHVIVQLGVNDIGEGWPGGLFPGDEVTVDELIQGYKQLIQRAHAKGVNVYGCTVNPFNGYAIPGTPFMYFTPENEKKRQAINHWIRTSGEYDGVIDFDKVLRDPDSPSRLLPAYDSGDHVHPTDEGYKALADSIHLALFRGGNH